MDKLIMPVIGKIILLIESLIKFIEMLSWPTAEPERQVPHISIITGAQPQAGTGHKMQSISVVFSTLHCEGYIADLRYRWLITSGSARWLIEIIYPPYLRHFEKHEAWRTVNRKTIAFWGTTRSPAFTIHEFMSENLRVNISRDNFTSDYLRMNLPSRNLSRNLY